MKNRQWQKWSPALAVLCMAAVLRPAAVRAAAEADEISALKQQQTELENRINQLEARQKLRERTLSERIEEVAARPEAQAGPGEPAGLPDSLKWLEKIIISGDFRYRYEYIDERERPVRNRNRMRARVGVEAELGDEWNLGFRLATGQGEVSGDPVSTNQTLGESFSRKPVWIDLAFLGYHPNWIEGLDIFAGKIENPFYRVGKNQLIWDSDLTPEGVGILYGIPLGGQTTLNWAAGGFWVSESGSSTDTSLWGIQAFLKHQLAKRTYILAGASNYYYGNIKGKEALATLWDNDSDFFGNTHTTIGGEEVYAGDYDLFEAFIEFGTELAGMPVVAFGDWVRNTVAADRNEDTGWLVGAVVNKAKAPGSWEFGYDYRDIELDAVVGQFNDSDFIGGGTGGKGHRFWLGYALARNVVTAVTYFDSQFDGRNDNVDYDRVQVDLALKF